MTTLTIDMPPELYAQLQRIAANNQRAAEVVVSEWIAERLHQASDERKRVFAALRAANRLAEPSQAMRASAAQATMTLDEVQAALDRTGGPPLSEVILAQRGPKT